MQDLRFSLASFLLVAIPLQAFLALIHLREGLNVVLSTWRLGNFSDTSTMLCFAAITLLVALELWGLARGHRFLTSFVASG